ncbi:MAG: mercuric reductase, partial [Dolichospermum sp.]
IVFKNGKVLGCSILGIAAAELTNIIALAITENIKIQHLAKLSPIYPSLSEILIATAREWHKQRINNNHAVQELLASFFNFRREHTLVNLQ